MVRPVAPKTPGYPAAIRYCCARATTACEPIKLTLSWIRRYVRACGIAFFCVRPVAVLSDLAIQRAIGNSIRHRQLSGI